MLGLPGMSERYSNPGMAMLGYCLTVSIQGTRCADLRTLLRERVMRPLGVPEAQWSVAYGGPMVVAGLPLVATWGGGAYSPDAAARVGRLLLRKGDWEGQRLLSAAVIERALKHSGLPGHSGLGWWVNREADGTKLWKSAPEDAIGGAGAGHQVLVVIPSLDMIIVRNGDRLDEDPDFWGPIDRFVIAPVLGALVTAGTPPYPPSTVIRSVRWAPVEQIIRRAKGSDTWPLTWADDDAQYTAYGDGNGFEPGVPDKLSMGFARIVGGPRDFSGTNIRSPTGERKGDGPAGQKASGMLALGGTLYLWARNSGNAQLAWSRDCGRSWTWSDWRFDTSFGCPTFLNFGKSYEGARDSFVYIYSPDGSSAYQPSDRMVLARVPKDRIAVRRAYEFFRGHDRAGKPLWSGEIADRQAVFEFAGGCGRSTISYDQGLKRYLWCQTLPGGDARFRGGFGIYDAPEPWGPWTTVDFTRAWDVGPGETCSLPTKWMNGDGRKAFLVFSGDDCFSVRGVEFMVDCPE